jgi:hypothetical protein
MIVIRWRGPRLNAGWLERLLKSLLFVPALVIKAPCRDRLAWPELTFSVHLAKN